MKHEEMQIQAHLVKWIKQEYPDILFTCIPSWAGNANQGAKNKKLGLLKGIPDLFFAEPRGEYKGLFIELKSATGSLSKEQKAVIANLRAKGYCVLAITGDNAFDIYHLAQEKIACYLA